MVSSMFNGVTARREMHGSTIIGDQYFVAHSMKSHSSKAGGDMKKKRAFTGRKFVDINAGIINYLEVQMKLVTFESIEALSQ